MLVKRLEILKKKRSTEDGRKLFDINLMEMRFISFFIFYWQRVPTLVRLETSFFSIRPNEQWVDFIFIFFRHRKDANGKAKPKCVMALTGDRCHSSVSDSFWVVVRLGRK